MDFKAKYLKYKEKYLQLKKQMGGWNHFCSTSGTTIPVPDNTSCPNCGVPSAAYPRPVATSYIPLAKRFNITPIPAGADLTTVPHTPPTVPNQNPDGTPAYPTQCTITPGFFDNLCFPRSGARTQLTSGFTTLQQNLMHYPGRNIRDNNICVYAELYRFNNPNDAHGIALLANRISSVQGIALSSITISTAPDWAIDRIRDLLTPPVPPAQAIPANTYLLCGSYTHDKTNPASEFCDVQLCVSGKLVKYSAYDETINPRLGAQRELREEMGLHVDLEHINLARIHNYGSTDFRNPRYDTYIVNAINITPNPQGNETNFLYHDTSEVNNRRVSVIIYGDLATLRGLVQNIVHRTDVKDIQGIVLVKLT